MTEQTQYPGWQDQAAESLKALADAHTVLDELIGKEEEVTSQVEDPSSQADAVSFRLQCISHSACNCLRRLGLLRERF